MRVASLIAACLGLAALACASDPVAGGRGSAPRITAREIAIAELQYAPARQTEGGDYGVDLQLVETVRDVGARLAAASPRPDLPYEFAVLDDPLARAWALPGGRIAVSRGLLVLLESEAELAAVLGHEIGHAAAAHGIQADPDEAPVAEATPRALPLEPRGGEVGNVAVQEGARAGWRVRRAHDEQAELEADAIGVSVMVAAGYDPQAAVALQERFAALSGAAPGDDDADGSDHTLDVESAPDRRRLEDLFVQHPPSAERVAALRDAATRLGSRAKGPQPLPQPLRVGAAEYRQAIARLVHDQEAYAASEEGARALLRGQARVALDASADALAIESDEPRFHALAGAAWLALGNRDEAEAALTRAIQLDADDYAWPLERARVRLARGDSDGAQADLERSLSLLPTAAAYFEVGTLLEAKALERPAMEHYRVAASAGGAWLARAGDPLARLELSRTPERWVRLEAGRDPRGFLTLTLENRAPFAVEGIEIEIARNEGGELRRDRLAIPGLLAAGGSLRRLTNLGPFADDAAFAAVEVRIAAVRPAAR